MAATPASLCLGCGLITQSEDRRNLSSQRVAPVWKNSFAKELERSLSLNLDDPLCSAVTLQACFDGIIPCAEGWHA